MLTLEEIARLSGTSRSTVSRVINGEHGVKEATRNRVLAVIQAHNFQPNRAARSLAGGRTRVIGLVIPQGVAKLFTDPYFPILIQGVSAACNARDYSVMLWLAEPEYERRMISQILYAGMIDGVIVSSYLEEDPVIEALSKGRLPFVLVGRHQNDSEVCTVDVDNRDSAKRATAYLFERSYQTVATITGPLNTFVGIDRYEGYKDAFREVGQPFSQKLVAEGDFTEESGYLGMQKILPHRPDAVFAASDLMAFGALRALYEVGRSVPHDVAIVGFDDVPAATRTRPPLTTMRQPIHELGGTAVDMLIDRLENPVEQPFHVLLATELVIRESA